MNIDKVYENISDKTVTHVIYGYWDLVINKFIYIGQTIKTLHTRNNQHFQSSIKKKFSMIDHLIRKNIDRYKIKILEKCANINELNEQEQYWIWFYKTFKNISNDCWNLHTGGNNHITSEETRNKLRSVFKGKIPTWCIGKSSWNKGIRRTEEEKKKISETRRANFLSGKIKSWNEGKKYTTKLKHTEEHKQKMSLIMKKYCEKRKQTNFEPWNKGRKWNEEQRRKISESMKILYKNGFKNWNDGKSISLYTPEQQRYKTHLYSRNYTARRFLKLHGHVKYQLIKIL